MNYQHLPTEELQDLLISDLQQLNELKQATEEIANRITEVKTVLYNRDPVCQKADA